MAKPKYILCDECLGFGWVQVQDEFGTCHVCKGARQVEVVKPKLPHRKTLTARLTRLYEAATAEEIHEGTTWYDIAREVAEALAAGTSYSVTQTAYAIAALSPNVSWAQNVATATIAVEGHKSGIRADRWGGPAYPENKSKAERILNGDLSALNGPKVTMFAEGILGNPEACTVDVWMQRAAGMDTGKAPSKKEHVAIRKALESGARSAGVSVRDFQAIVWTVIRNRNRTEAQRNA
jgi:hypothetical protein